MITDQTVRRLLQLVAVMVAEIVFFIIVPTPWPIRLLVGIACGYGLVRHWNRVANPKPKHSRKRLGPPAEWIDR